MNTFDLSQNYFELFNLKCKYEIDKDALVTTFQSLQTQYHPDKFVSSSASDSRQAMQISSLINEAYQTLKDPLKRAVYILSLNGIDLNTETDTKMDMAFLMEQMETREAMENITIDENGLDNIDNIATSISQKLKDLMHAISLMIKENRWDQAREKLREAQFINKINLEAKNIQENIEDKIF